ncbi:MAG: hypothetical protein A2W90_17240 [Bacteroidetes bacterium GWF2_42_66]|nr:MAG: hypothetical protein A2W92_07990 [Bacteroidetes bacterium GWA2_42_15]OFX96097.1 MAG: hypothetical protein A2W89_00175 [Bacteroidetes bacterium GWE2_42_39]OFY44189.1 MAG: hypothetical protein A2W90_17240 [Bacteroidetes bacterium GWF2_42_66]HBL75672.1 hypothetical protein [Prolixibacteraceae bacterium]HCR92206.1 hypothetical protein [Prolixibacteraceae bacterium]
MKKRNNLFIAFSLLAALAIGFLIGISVEYPRMNKNELSGTIGKVNNYRNTTATEADIELKNELLADTMMLNSVKNYINFYYVRAIEFGKNIDFAVQEANANEILKNEGKQQISALECYGKFLGTARKNLLLAVVACQSAEEADPVLLRNSIARANNIIAQMSYRNNVVLDFITGLDSFIQEKGIESNTGLNKAHDLLTYNEISSSLILKDKVLLKYFDKKKLYSNDLKSSGPINFKENIERDMESLGIFDSEKLGVIEINDVEKLGVVADAEELGQAMLFDSEKLGTRIMDTEKLGYVAFDAEKLGTLDAEKLNTGFWDAEKLGIMVIN